MSVDGRADFAIFPAGTTPEQVADFKRRVAKWDALRKPAVSASQLPKT